jgi:hypothetical protein
MIDLFPGISQINKNLDSFPTIMQMRQVEEYLQTTRNSDISFLYLYAMKGVFEQKIKCRQ